MGIIRRRFLTLAAAAAATPASFRFARSQEDQAILDKTLPVFPGAQWEAASSVELGWSIDGLVEANRVFDTLPPASIVAIDRGRLVLAWAIRRSALN